MKAQHLQIYNLPLHTAPLSHIHRHKQRLGVSKLFELLSPTQHLRKQRGNSLLNTWYFLLGTCMRFSFNPAQCSCATRVFSFLKMKKLKPRKITPLKKKKKLWDQVSKPGLCDSKDLEWMDSLSAKPGCLTGKLLMSLLHAFISSLLGLSQVSDSEMTLG